MVPDGAGGCFVLYEGKAKTGATFRNVEQIRFRDGLIVSAEVFFGRESGRGEAQAGASPWCFSDIERQCEIETAETARRMRVPPR